MSKKKKQNSIIEPTESELKLYKDLAEGFDEQQLDEFSKEYFKKVQQEEINVSFAKFVIDKIVRPIKEGDTIEYLDENNKTNYLFALVRKEIEDKAYIIFSKVDDETETLITEEIYLFYVDGYDENGIEIIDIMEAGEEAERILDIIEGDEDVEQIENSMPEKE